MAKNNWIEASKSIKIGLTKSADEQVWFSSGCTLLDLVMGGAKGKFGFPSGKFTNIVGDKSSGKTYLAMSIIAEAYHTFGKKLNYIYDDCESGATFDSEVQFGFPMVAVQSDTVEKAFYNITKFCETVKDGEFGIYILDSLDALTSHEDDERAEERIKAFDEDKKFDKGTYGMNKQKFMSGTFFPQLAGLIEQKNILLVIISQVRENIDTFSFEKYKRSGGKALDFYANSVLWLATQKKIIAKSRTVGVVAKAKTTKLKAPRPFRECLFSLLFDYGLDDIGSNLDYLLDLRTEQGELRDKRTGVDWNGEHLSREKMIEYIEEKGLESKLRDEVIAKWEAIEDSVASHRKKRYATQINDSPDVGKGA